MESEYLKITLRRNWTTWVWAALIAVVLNFTLFALMPMLQHHAASPEYGEKLEQINVIRTKRPDSLVKKKKEKPPEPPPEPKKQVKLKQTVTKVVKNPLRLPFELNPSLPQTPTDLALPDIDLKGVSMKELPSIFTPGQLDGPLTSMARIPPVYPIGAKRRGIEGWVKVRFVVDTQGNVGDIRIVEGKPEGLFDKSVIRCVSRWRFKPGTVEGVPVRTEVVTTVRFALE